MKYLMAQSSKKVGEWLHQEASEATISKKQSTQEEEERWHREEGGVQCI